MIELDKCPFCGEEENLAIELAEPVFMLKKYRNRYVVAGCKSCGSSTALIAAHNHTGSPLLNKANLEKAFKKAAEAWNRRERNEDRNNC